MSNYCVPYVYAKIMGVHPKEIARMIQAIRGEFEERGQKPFRRPTSPVVGVFNIEQEELRRQLGIKVLAEVKQPGMQVRTWIEARIKWGDENPWIVSVPGHACLYKGGMIYDNARPNGEIYLTHPCSRRRLNAARQINVWDERNPYQIGA